MKSKQIFYIIGICFLVNACAFNIKVPSFDTHQTKLEKQIMGTYEELDERIVLNVRGQSSAQTIIDKATFARQNQKFNQDDLEEFKTKQIIGETIQGYVALVPQSLSRIENLSEKTLKMAKIIIGEENQDRDTIFLEIQFKNKKTQETSLEQIKRTYALLKIKESKNGTWIQNENGEWQKK